MHINTKNTNSQGFAWMLCGALLWPGEGASGDAPMCPKCVAKNKSGGAKSGRKSGRS